MGFGRITRNMALRSTPKRYRKYNAAPRVRAALKRQITQIQETKYAAEYLSNVFAAITGAWNTWDPIANIVEGTDIFDERIGRRIAVTEFFMYGMLVGGCSNIAADDKYNCVRITGVVTGDNNPMGAATINDIVGKRMEGIEVERKFLDKYIVLNTVGSDSTGYIPNVRLVKIYKKFKKPIIIDFSQGNVPNKKIIISAISDSGLVPSPGFTVGHIAVHYKDV